MIDRVELLRAAVELYGAELGPIVTALAKIESDYDETAVGDNGTSLTAWQVHRPAWPGLTWPPPRDWRDQLAWIRPVVFHLAQSGMTNPPRWWRWGSATQGGDLTDRYRELRYETELRWAQQNVPAEFGAGQVLALLAMGFVLWLGTNRVRRTYRRFSTVRRSIAKLRR